MASAPYSFPFPLFLTWNEDVMAGALAAILDSRYGRVVNGRSPAP